VQSVQKERTQVMARAAKAGALHSGNTLFAVKNEYDRAASETADKIVRLAFDVTESTAQPVCDAIVQGLTALRDALSNDLAQFFRDQAAWAPRDATDGLGNDFLTAMDKRIAAAVDDLGHGIAGGARLSKDPLVSVITKITNSPGAVAQGGIGNVQHARISATSGDIRSALAQFLNSEEVQGLAPDDKQSVADVAEVLGSELDKQQPDVGKIGRWGKRLVDIAERLGIAIAASGLSRLFVG
jgi:hypothetical protein